MAKDDPTIGILALQGDFEAHSKHLTERLGVRAPIVRTVEEVEAVDGLILPGGESTTIGKLMVRFGVGDAIVRRVAAGMPVYGTCAGLIVLAREVEGSDQYRLGLLDVSVARNAFGRQIDSFEADISMPVLGPEPVRGVFIRAPYVRSAGPGVEVLAQYEGKIVAVRQGNILATAFHPELTDDVRVHSMFLSQIHRYLCHRRA
jgi:5'-phosphate synthase pdxT subunit